MARNAKKGLRENVTFVFEDESGYSERPTVRRTWAPKGKTPIIRSTGSWKSRTAVGMIACSPKGEYPRLLLQILRGSMKTPEAIAALKHLRRHVHGKVFLVWDGLGPHWSKAAKEWMRDNESWLTAFRFPAYAPELNPVEYLWSSSKGKDFANHVPECVGALEERIRKSGARIRKRPNLLRGFLGGSGLFDIK